MDNDNRAAHVLKLAAMLYAGETITADFIRSTFGVSRATSKRYMLVLEQNLPIVLERSEPSSPTRGAKLLRIAPSALPASPLSA